MPLLMCPNDNSAMTTVERSGVQFDMCPACRGVWLDRGELEKLMAAGRDDGGPSEQQAAWRQPRHDRPPEPYRRGDDDDDRRHGYRRKRGFDLFDIFD
jgi:Zn-finger nucleic acid-binding protein